MGKDNNILLDVELLDCGFKVSIFILNNNINKIGLKREKWRIWIIVEKNYYILYIINEIISI